jgi:predicted short-subunit dehydrogenase-like oxidoreductase (DUF2520 family)
MRSDIAVIGCGRVGLCLALTFMKRGQKVVLYSRSSNDPLNRIEVLPIANARHIECDIVLLAVKDDAIEEVSRQVVHIVEPNAQVGHLSGALGSSVLAPFFGEKRSFSAHPLYSFPPKGFSRALEEGILVMVEAKDEGCKKHVGSFFENAGFDVGFIEENDKALYHASAVLCANLPCALLYEASRLFERLGVPEATRRAFCLLRSVIANHIEEPGPKSLTGPLVRGDVAGIARNIEALQNEDESLAQIYVSLSMKLADIIYKAGIIEEDRWKKLKEVLKNLQERQLAR